MPNWVNDGENLKVSRYKLITEKDYLEIMKRSMSLEEYMALCEKREKEEKEKNDR